MSNFTSSTLPDDPLLEPIGISDGVVQVLKERIIVHMPPPEYTVIARPLRLSDPERSVGIYLMNTTPVEGSEELGQVEPVLLRHQFRIQNCVQAMEEDIGRRLFAVDAKIIKAILYRDAELRVRLHELEETLMGTVERIKKVGVRGQSFLNNELRGRFYYLATTDLWVESELTQIN